MTDTSSPSMALDEAVQTVAELEGSFERTGNRKMARALRRVLAAVPQSIEGLPPADDKRNWIGESADGRQWVLAYNRHHEYWLCFGFSLIKDMPCDAYYRLDRAPGFIIRSHLSPVQP